MTTPLGEPYWSPGAPYASRKWFVTGRWLTLLLFPFLAGWSQFRSTPDLWWLAGVFLLATAALQVRLRSAYAVLDHWLWHGVVCADLLIITGIVVATDGLHSDAYLLYILAVIEAGMILGLWQAMAACVSAGMLYSGVVLLVVGEVDPQRLLQRFLSLMIVGVVTAYLAASQKRALIASLTDFKTHLPNFRHFQQVLTFAVAQHKQFGRPLSVAILDVDNFKELNAAIGHPHADKVLEQLAELLVQNKRGTDLLARYGGEEFTMLLPGADQPAALAAMERLRALVEEHRFHVAPDLPAVRITISIGVALLGPAATETQLLVQADRALQQAKRGGKNRVCCG